MARIVAVVADLMLAQPGEHARSSRPATRSTQAPALAPASSTGSTCVVADLDACRPRSWRTLGVPVIGFYQHTDVETKRRADEAGLAIAVPRCRMVRELPELVERALG